MFYTEADTAHESANYFKAKYRKVNKNRGRISNIFNLYNKKQGNLISKIIFDTLSNIINFFFIDPFSSKFYLKKDHCFEYREKKKTKHQIPAVGVKSLFPEAMES